MTLVEKKQKLAAKVAEARGYLDAKDLEKYNNIDAEIDTLNAEIKAEEKQLEREAALAAIPDPQSRPTPQDNGKPARAAEMPEYCDAFMKAVREGKAVLSADEKKLFQNVLSTVPDAKGGFLVMPAEMEKSIRETLMENVAMRSLATVISATADKKIPFVTSFGAASWIGENGAYPKVDDSFGVKVIGSNKAGKIILVSEELLNDADFDLMAHINRSFARVFAEAEEAAYVTGDGVDKPTGFLTHAKVANGAWGWGKLGYVATGADGDFAAVNASDAIVDLVYALNAEYRANASFVMNSKTAGAVRKMKDADGRFLWSDGLAAGEPARLMGYPVLIAEDMPD
ncbi:MAG: phage major capsid protein, partial [Clostridia bacterium]|nr:phage major capsid protein [Clostridia bacterium]